MSTRKLKKFKFFKVVGTTASGRGIGDDPNDVVDAFEPNWEDL